MRILLHVTSFAARSCKTKMVKFHQMLGPMPMRRRTPCLFLLKLGASLSQPSKSRRELRVAVGFQSDQVTSAVGCAQLLLGRPLIRLNLQIKEPSGQAE